jgi:hypothetical protein
MLRAALAAVCVLLLLPAAARAGEPVMPLAQVQPGMRCQAASVVRGTEISTFEAEVLDVIAGQGGGEARILVRVSGPAIDATGVGPGFSGSPIRCPDAAGELRVAGAISEAIGEYGGKVVLATPIEAILATPVEPPIEPVGPQRARSSVPGARPLRAPLALSGVTGQVADAFRAAGRRAGRTLVTSPARPRALPHPPQPLVPGAAVAVGLASGDLGLGAVGTVAYADGDAVWAFGHPYEGAGRRTLILQDAFVHTVVNNPIATPDLQTYKLASPGHDVGTLTGDGLSAVTGRVGTPAPTFPLTVFGRDKDTGASRSLTARVADEGDVGQPNGTSGLGIAASAAVAQVATTVLVGGSPARQAAEMCLEVRVRELPQPLRACNDYVSGAAGGAPGGLIGPMVGDVGQAVALLDAYEVGTLHPTRFEVGLRLRRGTPQAFITGASAPGTVRRGSRIRVRLRLRRAVTGQIFTRTINVRIPRDAPRGDRELVLTGPPADASAGGLTGEVTEVLELGADSDAEHGPTSRAELRRAFAGLSRYTGLRARIRTPGAETHEDEFGSSPPRAGARAFRDPQLRISGRARIPVRVR